MDDLTREGSGIGSETVTRAWQKMVILAEKKGLLGVVEESQLTTDGMDDVRVGPGVSVLEVARGDRVYTGFDGE